jgi:hypothetical protein
MFTTVGFMAESGHGKDFCGEWVIKNQNYIGVAFADAIKRLCMLTFDEFSTETLWGDTKYRNAEHQIDWGRARHHFVSNVDHWLASLTHLLTSERAEYKKFVWNWFSEIEERAKTKPMTARLALQLLGTEYGRAYRDNIWVRHVLEEIIPAIKAGSGYRRESGLYERYSDVLPANGVVITDVRFINELAEMQHYGAYVIKVIRNSLKGKENTAEEAGIKGHASEAEMRSIPDAAFNLVLEMDDGAENVYPRLEQAFRDREFDRTEFNKAGLGKWTPPATP